MTISGISSSSSYLPTNNSTNIFQKIKQAMQQLGQDLQSGNISGAQQAFSLLTQYLPSSTSTTGSTASQSASGTTSSTASQSLSGTLAQDMTALGQALQSGDSSGAQTAFAQLQQDMQSVAKSGGHHHHHHGSGSQSSTSSTSNSNSIDSQIISGISQTVGTNVDTTS